MINSSSHEWQKWTFIANNVMSLFLFHLYKSIEESLFWVWNILKAVANHIFSTHVFISSINIGSLEIIIEVPFNHPGPCVRVYVAVSIFWYLHELQKVNSFLWNIFYILSCFRHLVRGSWHFTQFSLFAEFGDKNKHLLSVIWKENKQQ